jgi:class 3 adenylate cyclase/Tfp pilus assembly protein PilF
MKKYPALLLMLFSYTVCAQTNLDSLLTVWEDNSKPDSSRIRAFDDYIWDGFLYSQPDSALILSNELLYFVKKVNNRRAIASTLNMIGMAYYLNSENHKAINNHLESLEIQKEIQNESGIANSYNNIGMVYKNESDFIKAIEYYEKSIKIYKSVNNKTGLGHTLNNIGSIYKNQNAYKKALDYYKKSLENYEAVDYKLGIANVLNNIGNVHTEREEFIKAFEFYGKSLAIRKEINDKFGVANSLSNISDIYYRQGDYLKTLEYQKESLGISEEISDKGSIAFSLRGIGQIYAELGDYNEAIKYCNQSLKLSEEIKDISEQKMSCRCLYIIYKVQGNGSKALDYHEQMLVLNDSLKSEETAKKLQQMEFAKQVLADSLLQVEKGLQVEMVHQAEVRKKDKNRNLALGAGVFFLVLSGGFYSRWRYVKKSKTIIEKEKDRSENLLLNILPSEIAEELKEKGSADARDFDLVSILFTDFKGFTQASEKLTAKELIGEINHCFKAFDLICEKYGIEKIKTIGDAYMAAGGLPVPSDAAVKDTVLAALEMQAFITERIQTKEAKGEKPFKMRLGIHSGPVVAGIVGVKKFQYDIWGDTVNTASRMESSGEIGKVNISEDTYKLLKDDPEFKFNPRGKVQAKGKGEMKMFFVSKTA